jgi:hypothetical protein
LQSSLLLAGIRRVSLPGTFAPLIEERGKPASWLHRATEMRLVMPPLVTTALEIDGLLRILFR